MVIVCSEGEADSAGHLVVAAQFADGQVINQMTKSGGGLICLALPEERCRELGIPSLPSSPAVKRLSEFTVSVEAAVGVSTGISAADRARTIAVAIDPSSGPSDLVSPGHVFPLCSKPGGVMERPGAAEMSLELLALAGLGKAAVICQILNEDGSSASSSDLIRHGRDLGVGLIHVEDLLRSVGSASTG